MLKTNQQKINLGTLKFGQPHNFFFEVKNTGLQPVKIDRLVMGCNSCTKAHIESSLIAPNETTKLNVTFTPGSKGVQSKTLDIIYNGISLPLKFTATVNA